MSRRTKDSAWSLGVEFELDIETKGAVDFEEYQDRLNQHGSAPGNEVEENFNRGRRFGEALTND